VSGGSSGSAVLKSTELYDPVKNTWSAGADMKTARTGHTAVLLLNGKVLVAGGFDGKAALATAEIYDPASNTWTATTGPMAYSHNYHTATLLTSGKVLIAGGVLGPAIFADATITEVYDPTLGTFSAGPNLPEPRQGHTATVLQNGKVLFAGNSNGTATSAKLLTYTAPSTFAWTDDTTPTGTMATGRWNHAATLVASGKVLVTGGFGTNSKSAELYNPTTNLWEPAGAMANSRALHTSTLLRDGRVLIVGGYDGTNALNSIEVYDPTVLPATAGWSTAAQKVLNATRATHTSTLLSNGSVFVVGTYLQSGGTASATTDIWAP
jgi:N-acetylneuraminic acid mutarotase